MIHVGKIKDRKIPEKKIKERSGAWENSEYDIQKNLFTQIRTLRNYDVPDIPKTKLKKQTKKTFSVYIAAYMFSYNNNKLLFFNFFKWKI